MHLIPCPVTFSDLDVLPSSTLVHSWAAAPPFMKLPHFSSMREDKRWCSTLKACVYCLSTPCFRADVYCGFLEMSRIVKNKNKNLAWNGANQLFIPFVKCYKIVLLSINTVIKYGAYFLVVKITANYNNKYIINLQKKLHAVVAGLNFWDGLCC